MGSNGNACGAQPLGSLLWALRSAGGSQSVLARGGCKQALGASRCPQAPPVHPPAPSEPFVPWGKVSQLRKLKGHFNPPSGDMLCCSGCSTRDTSSLPCPTGCKWEVCSLPFPLQRRAPSLPLLREAHSQLRWGFLSWFLSLWVYAISPCMLLEGRLFLSPVSPELTR